MCGNHEKRHGMQEVGGSIPPGSTIIPHCHFSNLWDFHDFDDILNFYVIEF